MQDWVTFGDNSLSFGLLCNQSQWLTIIIYCAKDYIYEGWQYYASKCFPKLFGLQAEGHHTLVSLRWKAQRASRVLSKSCLTSAEESGMDTCQETSAGFLFKSGQILQWVRWCSGGWPSEEGNKCKFNIWGLFEVSLHLNECDRTWNDPRERVPSATRGAGRDERWWQQLKSQKHEHCLDLCVPVKRLWMCAHAQRAVMTKAFDFKCTTLLITKHSCVLPVSIRAVRVTRYIPCRAPSQFKVTETSSQKVKHVAFVAERNEQQHSMCNHIKGFPRHGAKRGQTVLLAPPVTTATN